ncbi:ribonuclease H-like protein, partial [Leucogyrophana mollusca]
MSAEGARPTAAQPTRPPQPVYPLYSWRSRSESARLAYIRDHRVADMEISNLVKGPLGFDLEWRPNFRKGQPENPVALIQLSTQDTVLLIQVTSMTEFPTKLRELLGNSQWIKAGVGIKYDCQKLYNDYGVSTRNCVDLSLLARSVDNGRWKGKYTNPLGLSRLLETYENRSLAKGKVTRSNWELNLSPIQQEYAANDAHAGYVIYTRLIAMAQAMVNIP